MSTQKKRIAEQERQVQQQEQQEVLPPMDYGTNAEQGAQNTAAPAAATPETITPGRATTPAAPQPETGTAPAAQVPTTQEAPEAARNLQATGTPGAQGGMSYAEQYQTGRAGQTAPAPQQEGVPQRTAQAARAATEGYAADMGPILGMMYQGMTDPGLYEEELKRIDAQLPRAVDEYRRTGRNPIADIVLEKQKPKRNVDEEERLRQNAKLLALNNVLSLIGRGIAASGGIRPGSIDNRPIYDIQNRLRQLDDLYRQEGVRYNQNVWLSALRKDQANQQAAQAAAAELQNRREVYADLYSDALENNRDMAAKMADKALEASKYRNEMAYKYDQLGEVKRHNKAAEGVQWKRLQYDREKDEPLVINNYTREPIPLNRENRAWLAMVASYLLDKRERTKGGGGIHISYSGTTAAPYSPGAKKPKVLNNVLSEAEWDALEKFTREGTLSLTAQGAMGRIAGALSKAREGDLSDLGVPPLPKRPKMTPSDPDNKKEMAKANALFEQFIDEAAETVRGQMEFAEMEYHRMPTVNEIAAFNKNEDTQLTPQEWLRVYARAYDKFMNAKSGR